MWRSLFALVACGVPAGVQAASSLTVVTPENLSTLPLGFRVEAES